MHASLYYKYGMMICINSKLDCFDEVNIESDVRHCILTGYYFLVSR
jgi:hypothetical protein